MLAGWYLITMQFIKYYHAEHYRHILISINVIVVAFEVCMNVMLHTRRKIIKNNQWRGLVERIHLFQLTYRHEISITTFENICITLHLLCIYYALEWGPSCVYLYAIINGIRILIGYFYICTCTKYCTRSFTIIVVSWTGSPDVVCKTQRIPFRTSSV